MRLFNVVVTPSALHGSGSWTMTREREKLLQVAQHRMLRLICGVHRRKHDDDSIESWIDWLKRATSFAEEAFANSGGEFWIVGQRRRKWRWAGKVARLSDRRWTMQTLDWNPVGGRRGVGRPALRWDDAIVAYFAGLSGLANIDWYLCAQDEEAWNEHEEPFCNSDEMRP